MKFFSFNNRNFKLNNFFRLFSWCFFTMFLFSFKRKVNARAIFFNFEVIKNNGFKNAIKHNFGLFAMNIVVHSFFSYFYCWRSERFLNGSFFANSLFGIIFYNFVINGFLCFIHCLYANSDRWVISIISQIILFILAIIIVDLLTYFSFKRQESLKIKEENKEIDVVWDSLPLWKKGYYAVKFSFSSNEDI